jgi:hypothetical protein
MTADRHDAGVGLCIDRKKACLQVDRDDLHYRAWFLHVLALLDFEHVERECHEGAGPRDPRKRFVVDQGRGKPELHGAFLQQQRWSLSAGQASVVRIQRFKSIVRR